MLSKIKVATVATVFVLLVSFALPKTQPCNRCLRGVKLVLPAGVDRPSLISFYLRKVCRLIPLKQRPLCYQFITKNDENLVDLYNKNELGQALCSFTQQCQSEDCVKCLNAAHTIAGLLPKDFDPVKWEPVAIKVCEKYHGNFGIREERVCIIDPFNSDRINKSFRNRRI
ncbi:hypothetical protein GEMRC1_004300 [Eukaryota sp. GEM-RC1]